MSGSPWFMNMHMQHDLTSNIFLWYMASSVSRQDEPNPTLQLATQVGKVEGAILSSYGDLPVVGCKKYLPNSHVINPLLTKPVWSRWLDIGFVLFLQVYGHQLHLGPRSVMQKKNLANMSAILTSHLVNSPCIWCSQSADKLTMYLTYFSFF